MTLADLIARYRLDANDKAEPYFLSDEDVTGFVNDALREACVRGRLIHESLSPDVCSITVQAGVAVYPLHPALYELTYVGFYSADGSLPHMLPVVSTEWLDSRLPDWRSSTGSPRYVVQDDTSLRIVPSPDGFGTIKLEGYRAPLEPLLLADKDTARPEIHEAHHANLIQWVLHRVFSIPDMEMFDPNRAAIAGEAFTRYFGIRPDADMRRLTREDVPHHVEAFWP